MERFYDYFGYGLLSLLFGAHLFGWSFLDKDVIPNVPKDVRDNPGSYRSVYRTHTTWWGGK
ncbi:MAG: hypothetical protein FJX76_13295 [Armatimonadetes bacterium]|nr:hypothetical protein [Armatimonadota bacterium]